MVAKAGKEVKLISERLAQVPASPIRKLVPYATTAKKSGVKVYHLNIGDPDILTPDVMIDVLKKWNTNPISYGLSQGQPEFLEALKWYYHTLGFPFIDIPNIQVTSGGSEAISMALFATAMPGDEVLVFEPFYANYNSYAVVNGITLVPVKTSIENGFHLPTVSVIEKKITKKTKVILYCNPNNPTGTVYDKKEIEMLVKLAKKHNVFLLADEVYREFTYDGKKQISILSYMQEIPELAVLLDSMSKRYSLCGVRLGCIVSLNKELMAGALRMSQGRLSSGFVDQAIASELTHVPASYFKKVHDEYEKRRDILFAALRNISGVSVPKPEGAFYAIVKLPVDNAEDFCKWLLTDFRDHNETVMVAPAGGFYATPGLGKNEIRVAYVINIPSLIRAVELLRLALEKYKQ